MEMEEQNRGCPCHYLDEPCKPRCTCLNQGSSSGCIYCCTYGSIEQRKTHAEWIAGILRNQLNRSKVMNLKS